MRPSLNPEALLALSQYPLRDEFVIRLGRVCNGRAISAQMVNRKSPKGNRAHGYDELLPDETRVLLPNRGVIFASFNHNRRYYYAKCRTPENKFSRISIISIFQLSLFSFYRVSRSFSRKIYSTFVL